MTTKMIFYTILVFTFFSCGQGNSLDTNQEIEKNEDTLTETVEIIDEVIDTTNENLIRLSENPIDLIAFKKEYGNSHSGSGNSESIYDLPDTNGFMYSYFFFLQINKELRQSYSTDQLFSGFYIYVYKFGNVVGRFSDTNEVLMGIKSRLNMPQLKDLNFVGMEKPDVLEFIGKPYFVEDNLILYQYENKVLTLHLKNDIIDWFKFVKMDPEIDLSDEIPFYLKSFDQ